MPDVDEFGIPIRKASTQVEVDEFGIPIKKKIGDTTSPITGIPSVTGFDPYANVIPDSAPAILTEQGRQAYTPSIYKKAKEIGAAVPPAAPDKGILNTISQALYLPALNQGFTESITKPIAGATSFVDRTIDKAYTALTGEQTPSWLRKGGAFDKIVNHYEKAYAERDKPTNLVSEVAEGTVGTIPLIAALSTGQGEANMLAKAPETVGKLATFLGATGALNSFKDATDEGRSYTESIKKATLEGGKKFTEGLGMEAQILLSGAFGKGVADILKEKGINLNKSADAILHALSLGTVFGGTQAGSDLVQGKDIDTREAAKQFGMGLAFGVLPIAKGIGADIKDSKNDKAVQQAALAATASHLNAESAIRSLITLPKDKIAEIDAQVEGTKDDLYAGSIESGVKAFESESPEEKRSHQADQLIQKTQGDVKLMGEKINENYDEVVKTITDSEELSPEIKTDLLDKVEVLKKPDAEPLVKAATDLEALKQVSDKMTKYEASLKRLTAAKNEGAISAKEFDEMKARFDDVMEGSDQAVKATPAPTVDETDKAFDFNKTGTQLNNFDNPVAVKEVSGIEYRIAENENNDPTVTKKKSYVLYKGTEPIGIFDTVEAAKNAVPKATPYEEVTPQNVADVGLGDTVTATIKGKTYSGKVENVSGHKNKPVIDFTDENGDKRFAYPNQISDIQKRVEPDFLTPEQKNRLTELVKKTELTKEEITELGELGTISRKGQPKGEEIAFEEIKKGENTDAIQKRESKALPVGEPSRDSREVGKGVPEPKEPAKESTSKAIPESKAQVTKKLYRGFNPSGEKSEGGKWWTGSRKQAGYFAGKEGAIKEKSINTSKVLKTDLILTNTALDLTELAKTLHLSEKDILEGFNEYNQNRIKAGIEKNALILQAPHIEKLLKEKGYTGIEAIEWEGVKTTSKAYRIFEEDVPAGLKAGDKVKFIDHLGEPETGKVLEIKPDGNVSVLKSNGVKNNISPEKLTRQDATQDRKSKLAAERIQVQRTPPERSTKKLNTIIKDLTAALKAPLIYAKSRRRNALGSYNPSNALVNLRNAGDLDTAAHEIGHLVDDRFDLLTNTPAEAQKQLKWFSDRGGSNPPAQLEKSRKQQYLQREGLAEFIRAYIANPAEAKNIAPELYDHFESTVNKETLSAIKAFSKDYITLANAPAGDQILANIMEAPDLKEKQSTIDWLMGRSNSDSGFKLTWVDDLKAQVSTSLHIAEKAFEYAKNMKGVGTLLPEKNFETVARVFAGENGKLDRIFKSGLVDAKNKYIKDNGENMTAKWLFEPLDATSKETLEQESRETIQYLVAQRTLEYAKKFGRQDKLSGIGAGIRSDVSVATEHLEDFKKLDPAKADRIKEAARRYREYADQGLKYALSKGRISQEQYDAIKEGNEYYVSLARTQEVAPTEEPLSFISKSGGKGLTSVKQVLNKAKGGTGTIQNPYVSLFKNTSDIISDSDRNAVLQNFVEVLTEQRNMGEGEVKALSEIGRQVEKGEKNTKTVFVDGKPQFWQFPEEVYKSLTAIEAGSAGGLGEKIATFLPKVLRWSVTHYPAFAVKNLIRDTQQRLIQSRSGGGLRDLTHTLKDRELFDLYGGSQAGFHLASREAYYERMKGAIKELTDKGDIVLDPRSIPESVYQQARMTGLDAPLLDVSRFKGAGKSYVKFLEKSENVNRIAEFKSAHKKARAEGMDDYNAGLYAAYQGRDLLDFAVAGHFIRQVNRYIPFTNAAVQGLRRTVKSVKEKPADFALKMALYSVIPQLAVRALNYAMDNDDEYEQLPWYQRDLFYNFKTPLTGDKWISIPKPFDLGLVSSGIDRLVSVGMGKKDAFEGYARSSLSVLSPFDESTLLPVAKPLVEIIANKDLYRNEPIVPEWEEKLMLNKRTGTKYASGLGKSLTSAFGFVGAEVDPRYIDHAVRGLTSYYGDAAMRLSNIGSKNSKQFGIEQTGLVRERPIANSKDVMETYDLAQKLGVDQSSGILELRDMVKEFYGAETKPERERLSKEIYKKASKLREELMDTYEKARKQVVSDSEYPATSTVDVRDNDVFLTPEQLKERQKFNDEFIKDHGEAITKALKQGGKSKSEIHRSLKTRANKYSEVKIKEKYPELVNGTPATPKSKTKTFLQSLFK